MKPSFVREFTNGRKNVGAADVALALLYDQYIITSMQIHLRFPEPKLVGGIIGAFEAVANYLQISKHSILGAATYPVRHPLFYNS